MSRRGSKTSLLGRLRRRRFLAIDFDSAQLRVADVVRGPLRPRVRRLVACDMPADVQLDHPEQVGQFLARVIKQHRLTRSPVVMNIPRGQAVLKPLRLPPGTAGEETASMVQFQVQGELPFRAEEAVLDFTVEAGESQSEESNGVDVLAAAVRLPVVDYYRNVAETAGVKLMRLGLRPYANTRCVQVAAPGDAGTRTAVVQVTADETQIDVVENGRMVFSRSAVVKVVPEEPLGEHTEQTAEELIERERTTRERIDMVVSEIVRSLQGFAAMENAGQVDRILIAGGTGLESGVAEMLGQVEDLNCRIFNPAESVKLSGVKEASAFITVIGLAFEAGADREPFDFLHPKKPTVHRDPKRERIVAAALAAMILLFISAFGSWFYLNSKEQEVDDLLSRDRREEDRQDFVEPLVKRVRAVDEWAEESISWLDHWTKLTALLPPVQQAYVEGLRTSREGMTFVIHARNSDIIAAFVERLREAGYEPRTSKDSIDQDNVFGYSRQTEIALNIDSDLEIDVAELDAPGRPEDDDLNRPLDEVRRGRRR